MKSNTWTEKEIELLKKYYNSKGPSYCSDLLGRSKRGCKNKAKKIGIKFDASFKYEKEKLILIIKDSKNYTESMKKLGVNPRCAGNMKTLKKYIKIYEIDISHFKDQYCGLQENALKIKIPLEKILVENSTYNISNLKKRLYKEGLKQRSCEICGQGEIWNDKYMSLILDHKNGIPDDNRLENLRIVCPNCNATLDTHCRGDIKNKKIYDNNKNEYVSSCSHKRCVCGRVILKSSKLCKSCAAKNNIKYERPPIEQLKKDVEEFGYCATGRKYGVADNTIRKWINK